MFLLSDDSWEVKHTLKKGNGVFAKKKIAGGVIIGDYLGMVVDIAEYDLKEDIRGLYLMYYNDRAGIYPDLNSPGPHLLNHSCEPNCWIYPYKGRTLFFSIRDINPSEELTIAYLLSPKDELCAPCLHGCNCESIGCAGTMHLPKDKYEAWQIFQDKERSKTRPSNASFGEKLDKLAVYPSDVPADYFAFVVMFTVPRIASGMSVVFRT